MEHDGVLEYGYISENIKTVREKISKTAIKYNRDPDSITVIGVSKTYPAEAAAAALYEGLTDLGENRAEELLDKALILEDLKLAPKWHMIGTLQRRKVKQLIGVTSLIHSVDSIKLLEEISTKSVSAGVVTDILFELNIAEEESKHGFLPSQLNEITEIMLSKLPGVKSRGIMTMAPFTDSEYVIEKVFDKTREVFLSLSEIFSNDDFNVLSMGMSNDYQMAVKYASTHLRIGTAIFGRR
ncbi:MAG: YggS family pyridoxal phosphate-dependent enzyme [Eubacteriales bacterium]|nr:YggS family pyridoxal phosphate-dependent enzyme [Eubacteriales bacterium]